MFWKKLMFLEDINPIQLSSSRRGKEQKIHPGSARIMRKIDSLHSGLRADTQIRPNKNTLLLALAQKERKFRGRFSSLLSKRCGPAI